MSSKKNARLEELKGRVPEVTPEEALALDEIVVTGTAGQGNVPSRGSPVFSTRRPLLCHSFHTLP